MATWSEVETNVRALTNHDSDTQVTTAQLLLWCNLEYTRLRRILGDEVPGLYLGTELFTITSGNTRVIAATDFSKVYRLESSYAPSTQYRPLDVASRQDPEGSTALSFLENGGTLEIYPSPSAVGSYRLTYVKKPVALVNPGDTVALPDELVDVLAQRLAARVKLRLPDTSHAPHLDWAEAAMREALSFLKRRYGSHDVGLNSRAR